MKKYSSAAAAAAALLFLLAVLPTAASAQDWAKARLQKSSRHQDWVQIKNGDRTVPAFGFYPDAKAKPTAVIPIPDISGITACRPTPTHNLPHARHLPLPPLLLTP